MSATSSESRSSPSIGKTSLSKTSLPTTVLAEIESLLGPDDARTAARYPGDDGSRQPIHTVYVPAQKYEPGIARAWGDAALEALTAAGGVAALVEAVGVPEALRAEIGELVVAKLEREPIEDLRVDLEDGYGSHGDAEDDVAFAAATTLRDELDRGVAAPFAGIRFKSFEGPTRARGIKTLDLFVTGLLGSSQVVPSGGLHLTLPKVTSVEQVEAMVRVCEALEAELGLPVGFLRFEIQIETPQSVLGPDGTALVSKMLAAGGSRVSGMPYGTYDYSASLGIAAAYQSMEHPVADHAKSIMQLAAAGTGVRLSDGSTNVLPVGDPTAVASAWALHGRLVRRSLERGYYQGWDMHPAQLPSRFAATYAFFREGLPSAAQRLGNYLRQEVGAVLDEPATARAMAWFLCRGLDCGAITESELAESQRLSRSDLDALVRPARETV